MYLRTHELFATKSEPSTKDVSEKPSVADSKRREERERPSVTLSFEGKTESEI
jgi:hypothetical protein